MARYAMAIDIKRCFGCQTCAVACKMANGMPKGVAYSKVLTVGGSFIDTARGSYPDCSLEYLPFQCQHCEKPACMAACPTGATQQRDDGIVSIDGELCIGCASCIEACPYEGVRTLLEGAPDYYLDMVVGEADAPAHRGGTVEKCTFCYNLVDRGEPPPACSCVPAELAIGAIWTILNQVFRGLSQAANMTSCMKKRARARKFTISDEAAVSRFFVLGITSL